MEIIRNTLEIPKITPSHFPDLVKYLTMPHDQLPLSLYDEYYELAKELHYPAVKNYYNIQCFDKNGRLENETGRTMSRSMLRNQWNYMLWLAAFVLKTVDSSFGDTYLSLKDTGGTVRAGFSFYNPSSIGGALADTSYGLLVGITNTAVDFDDYNLAGKCAQGTGANQLEYQAAETVVQTWDGINLEWTITQSRYANNNSSANIDLVEVGAVQQIGTGGTPLYVLMVRDVFASETVNVGGQVLMICDFISNTFPE